GLGAWGLGQNRTAMAEAGISSPYPASRAQTTEPRAEKRAVGAPFEQEPPPFPGERPWGDAEFRSEFEALAAWLRFGSPAAGRKSSPSTTSWLPTAATAKAERSWSRWASTTRFLQENSASSN